MVILSWNQVRYKRRVRRGVFETHQDYHASVVCSEDSTHPTGLTVRLNGELVIENAQLPGVAPRGPIALQHHGDPIEFASILIRELP